MWLGAEHLIIFIVYFVPSLWPHFSKWFSGNSPNTPPFFFALFCSSPLFHPWIRVITNYKYSMLMITQLPHSSCFFLSCRDGVIFSSPSSKGGRDHPCFTATSLTVSTGLFEYCCSFDLFLLFLLFKLWQLVGPDEECKDQGPPRRAKWWYSTFHTVTAMIGAGVLSLPHAMAYLGWYIYTLKLNSIS